MIEVLKFQDAYDTFEKLVRTIPTSAKILEVGAGAYPSLDLNKYENYYLLDPDSIELNKNKSLQLINSTLENWETEETFDFVISHMVLEHVKNPLKFHTKVFEVLNKGGKAYHFFACGNSLPGIINSIIPEKWSNYLLRVTRSRDIEKEPKYKAYYNWTSISNKSTLGFYHKIGFSVEKAVAFLGHNYLHAVPVLNKIELLFSDVLYYLKIKRMASVSLLTLRRN